eukprot:6598443-Prymnesium_polylepis.1
MRDVRTQARRMTPPYSVLRYARSKVVALPKRTRTQSLRVGFEDAASPDDLQNCQNVAKSV